jgi:medium-chain acyl-[acyl-carrier-protein] hydrolase
MNDQSARHDERFKVRSYDVDPSGRLRLVILNKMLQEAAWQHAKMLGKGFVDRSGGYYWVLARLRLMIDLLPKWGEEFIIRTFPVGTDRMFALREFILFDAEGERIGQAASAWLVIDSDRGRPVRPQPVVADLIVSEPTYPGSLDKLAPPDEQGRFGPHPVRLHDIDQYKHVNNTAYLEWILDCIDDNGVTPDHIVAVKLDFLQETLLTDEYSVLLDRRDGLIRAEVRRLREDQACCRAHLHSR